jgi:SGNH domain (fused to AT3 domains)
MFAAWENYTSDWRAGTVYESSLVRTIQLTKDAGASNILLVGPAPRFLPTLPTIIFQAWRLSRSDELPNRLMLDESSTRNLTDQLSKVAGDLGISYLSTMNVFCNADGCLAIVPGTKTDLVSWDSAHLTTPGAKYLAEAIKLLQLVRP